MYHIFNTDIACTYGIEEAVLLENIAYWVLKNKANDKGFFEGRYWTYNSAKAFAELFPYITERKIARLLVRMEEEGLILSGYFNESAYNRTKWYTLSDKGAEVYNTHTKSGMFHLSNLENGTTKDDKSITDINHILEKTISINRNSKKVVFKKPSVEDVAAYCRERNNGIDAEAFVDFYNSKGWKIGNSAMKDWEAAVRTWERKEKDYKNGQSHGNDKYGGRRGYTDFKSTSADDYEGPF